MNFRDMVDALVRRVDDNGEFGTSDELIIRIPEGTKLSERLVESQWKKYNNQYDTRLDRRPPNQGGGQLHIRNRDGREWAYRYTGARSEPNKYTLNATGTVQDIVRSIFDL